MKRQFLIGGALILSFMMHFVFLNIEEKGYREVTRLEMESAEKNLLAQGLTHEQTSAIVWFVTEEANEAAYHARSVASNEGLIAFIMAFMVFIYASREKS